MPDDIKLNPILNINTVEKMGTVDDLFAHRILGAVASIPEAVVNLPNYLMAGAQALPGFIMHDPVQSKPHYDAAMRTIQDAQNNRRVISSALGIPARAEGQSLTQDLVEAGLGALAGVPKAAGTAINLATNAPVKAGIGTRIAEAVTPLTLPLTPANIAVNAGAGMAITAGAHALTSDSEPVKPAKINSLLPEPQQVNSIADTFDATPFEAVLDAQDPMRKTPEEKNYETAGYLAGAGALAAGIFFGSKYMRRIREPFIDGGPNVKGEKVDAFGMGTKVATELVDSNIPMREIIKRSTTMTPDQKDLALARLDNYTRAAAGSKVEYALNTGELVATDPAKAVTIPAYRKWKDQFDTLSSEEQDGINRLLALQDQQDMRALAAARQPAVDVNLATNQLSSPIRPGLTALDDADIAQQITALQANPKIRELTQNVRQMTQGALQYLSNEGIIKHTTAQKWWRDHPHFMPNIEDPLGGATGFVRQWKAMVQATKQSFGLDHWDDDAGNALDTMHARKLEQGGGIDKPMAATEVIPHYLNTIQRMVMQNEVRRTVAQTLLTDPQFKGIVRKVNTHTEKAHLKDPNVFKFAENGKQYAIEVKDPVLAQSMRINPHLPTTWFGAMGKLHADVFQMGTTGLLAPWFALTNVLRETQQLAVTKGDRSFGVIDKALKGYFPGDPTSVVHTIAGTADNLFGGLMKASHEALSKWAFKFSDGAIPQPMLDNMAAAAQKGYLRTARALMEKHGAFQGMHLTPMFKTGLERLLPEYENSQNLMTKGVARVYRDLLSSVHQGARTGFVLANYKKGMSEAEVEKLMSATQDALGNPNLRGEGLPWGVPYLNPAIQGTRSVMQAFKEHPARASLGLANGLLMPPLIGVTLFDYLGPEWMDFYNNQVPEYKKATTILVPSPELIAARAQGQSIPVDPTQVYEIPMVVDTMLTPAINAAREMYMAAFGFNQGRMTDQGALKNVSDATRSALYQGLALPLPIPEAVMIAATGHEITPQGIAPVKSPGPMGLVGSGQSVIGGMDIKTMKVLETILGTAGKMALSAAETGSIEATLEAKDAKPIEKVGAFMTGAGTQIKEDLKKRVPSANVVFGEYTNPRATPLKEEMRRDLDAIKAIQEQFNIDFTGGTNAAARRPVTLSPIASPFLSSDPQAQPLIADVALLLRGNAVIRAEKQRLTDLYAQRSTLDGAKHQPDKRIELNKVQDEINQRDRTILLEVRELEEQVAKKYNLPGFRVRHLLVDRGQLRQP